MIDGRKDKQPLYLTNNINYLIKNLFLNKASSLNLIFYK